MGSVKQFATCAKSIAEVLSPFREALTERGIETESVKHLIFSPAFGTTRFRTLASIFCVTDQHWLIVTCDDNGSTTVAECAYNSTLLVEMTLILLYGQLKMDFVQNDEAKSATLHFNAVLQHIYSEAVQYILDAIDGKENVAMTKDRVRTAIFADWPLKFRNFAIIYMPKKSQLLDGVCWREMRAGFGRELAPAAAVLVTDRHIVAIAEEKSSRWFQFRHHAKYGAIITYFPLNRLADSRIKPHPRFCILELYGYEGHGGKRLDIIFPRDKREAVSRVMARANPDRVPVSPANMEA
jgi:hypothetical protein